MKKILTFIGFIIITIITHAQEVNLAQGGVITSCNISSPSPGGSCDQMNNLIDGDESTIVTFIPETTDNGGGNGNRYYKLRIDLGKAYNISAFMVKAIGNGLHIGGIIAGVNADSVLFEDDSPNMRLIVQNQTFYNLLNVRTQYLTFILDDNGQAGTSVNIQEIYIYGYTSQLFSSNWTDIGKNSYFIPGGNVSIGYTSLPNEKLVVAGNVKAISFIGDGSKLTGINSSQWSTNTSGINYSGNVGIGTTPTNYKLTIAGDIYANGGWLRTSGNAGLYFESYGGGLFMSDPYWIRTYGSKNFYHDAGVMRTDGIFQVGPDGDRFVVTQGGAVGIGTKTPNASYKLDVNGNVKATSFIGDGSQLTGVNSSQWSTNTSGINYSGNVGIGISDPGTYYKLNVWGSIRAHEVIVNTTGSDFVFDSNYKLRSLKEVESFIKQNKHLPEIAPAAEMQANGVGLADLQTKLLQKLEEMTLYVIEQNKKLEQQSEKIQKLEEKVEKLSAVSK